MNRIKVLFFATLREQAGAGTLELDIEAGATVRQLKEAVTRRFPVMDENLRHCLAAVNHEYSEDDAEIPPGAEVAFFPPVSGG